MGAKISKVFSPDEDRELKQLRKCLAHLLLQLSPEEILTFALEEKEIYYCCRDYVELRQACILACVRRYHEDKFYYEEVYNRSADFMILLDEFIQIQDEYDNNDEEEEIPKRGIFSWKKLQDREGDAAANGEDSETEDSEDTDETEE